MSASSPKTVTSTEIKFSPPELKNFDLDDGLAYDGQTQCSILAPIFRIGQINMIPQEITLLTSIGPGPSLQQRPRHRRKVTV